MPVFAVPAFVTAAEGGVVLLRDADEAGDAHSMKLRFPAIRRRSLIAGLGAMAALIAVGVLGNAQESPTGVTVTSDASIEGARMPVAATLLVVYLLIALFFSFVCSVFEAVLLSIRRPYVISQLEKNPGNAAAWERLLADVNRPLSAILILNTVAHTVGAAGVGAQGVAVFGDRYALIISGILTVLILVLSEIIPKTIGAVYWKALAPLVGKGLQALTTAMSPFVWLTVKFTSGLSHGQTTGAYSREEFTAIADIAHSEGSLELREMDILKNLLSLRFTKLEDVMTPRTVLFALPKATTTKEFVARYSERPFSRIPVYGDRVDEIDGFVLRSDILFAAIKHPEENRAIGTMQRNLKALPETMPISKAFDAFLGERSHIAMVVDEFGAVAGIVTLEDIVETLLGLEIVDEVDRTEDMQALARRLWKTRAERMGIIIDPEDAAVRGDAAAGGSGTSDGAKKS